MQMQVVRHMPSEEPEHEACSPEWAGLDRTPARRAGFPEKAVSEYSTVTPSEEWRQIEEAAAEAAQALRAIAAEAEARVHAEHATSEVLAHQVRQEQALVVLARELQELRGAHQKLVSSQQQGKASEWRQVEDAAAEAQQALRAIVTEAEARVQAEHRRESEEVVAQQARQEQVLLSLAHELSQLRAAHERLQAQQAQQAQAKQATPSKSLDKTTIVEEVLVRTSSTPKAEPTEDLSKTVEVNPKLPLAEEEKAEKATPSAAKKTDLPTASSPDASPIVDRDVMRAVEKARAAVAELQRHAGLLEVPSLACMDTVQVQSCPPFSHETVGLNILLSPDGYTATRSCGCRESVAICKGPLQLQEEGLYFEVEVLQTVDGWLGGLGIGVTHANPSALKDQRLPDKASKVPGSFILGYAGSKYLNGNEDSISWQPDQLRVGQRVGLLLDGTTNDLAVNVDGQEVARVLGDELRLQGLGLDPLYGIVDVYNATLSVRLRPGATPPRA